MSRDSPTSDRGKFCDRTSGGVAVSVGRHGARPGGRDDRRCRCVRVRRVGAGPDRQFGHRYRLQREHMPGNGSAPGRRRLVSPRFDESRMGDRRRFRDAAGRALGSPVRRFVSGLRQRDLSREPVRQQFMRARRRHGTLPLHRQERAGGRPPGDRLSVRRMPSSLGGQTVTAAIAAAGRPERKQLNRQKFPASPPVRASNARRWSSVMLVVMAAVSRAVAQEDRSPALGFARTTPAANS